MGSLCLRGALVRVTWCTHRNPPTFRSRCQIFACYNNSSESTRESESLHTRASATDSTNVYIKRDEDSMERPNLAKPTKPIFEVKDGSGIYGMQLPTAEEGVKSKILGRKESTAGKTGTFCFRATTRTIGKIHPTAIVHPDAVLSEGVEIGAYCTVGPGVKLGLGCKLHPGSHIFGKTQLGDRCELLTGAVVGADIPGHTVIGDDNTLGYHAVVGVKCQDMKYKESDDCFLYMGNNNDIREFVSIHRSSKVADRTVIGNNNLIMGYCHIAHDCKLGDGNILANSTLLGGHVVVEDFVHTGGAAAVHQFCHIGSFSFLAGGSMVDRDVPMYMMVAGNRAELRGLNLEGLRRNGFIDSDVRSIRRAYQKLFMNSDSDAGGLEDRLSLLERDEEISNIPAVSLMLRCIRDSFGDKRRGICKFRQWTTV